MRPLASALFVGLAAVSLVIAGCMGRTQVEEVLPWLRILRTESAQTGIFSGPRSGAIEARYFGVWHQVDADFAEALSPDTALLYRFNGPALLHLGEYSGRPICTPHSIVHVPPARKAVDCIDGIEGRGRDGAARLGYQRPQGAASSWPEAISR
jgi:hypothetical protein